MTDTPWKTENWHTSQWNFAPEVLEEINFPDVINIHDVTLRDGEQQAGLAFDFDDKIRIAEGLAEVGVQRIEAGMPVVSPDDAKVVQELARRDFGPKVYAFARCMVDDVKRAVDSGVAGVIMEVPASPHLIEKGYRWELDRAIDLSIESNQVRARQRARGGIFPDRFFAFRSAVGDRSDQARRATRATWTGWHSSTPWARPRSTPCATSCAPSRTRSTCRWRPTSTWTTAWAWPTRSWHVPRASRSSSRPSWASASAPATCQWKRP